MKIEIDTTSGTVTITLPAIDAASLNMLAHGDEVPDPTFAERLSDALEEAEEAVG